MFSRTPFIIITLILIANAKSRTIVEYCTSLPETTLTTILGSAYNPRYMSIDEPRVIVQPTLGNKRALPEEDFFVNDDYHQEISNKPAWEFDHISEKHLTRNRRNINVNDIKETEKGMGKRDYRQTFLQSVAPSKRGNIFQPRPWECNSQIRWIDLGYEYFPRYLRTVECTKKQCWYGHYTCKPRSFTVKVLRRKIGECTRISEKLVMASQDKMTGEFTQLWIWEEKAVNFCCDCVMN
ncbi:protein trunk [Condylostylus longicornis]|uniref:protein trunk n=1 Tax=Condylostylus longicornis TaxID=2530218 RepID=UPI00244DCD38|nr:protein trunk [Condylostylus longicornis]